MPAPTNFSQYSHEQLVAMLNASDPHSVSSAGDRWSATGKALHERASDLDQQLQSFQRMWQGGAADQYKVMITDLASGIRKVADTALGVRDVTYHIGDALAEARAKMPPVVSVPSLTDAVVQIASFVLPTDTSISPQTLAALQQQKLAAKLQIEQQQQAAIAAESARAKAVAVMTELAGRYTVAEQTMPVTPQAAAAPTITRPDNSTPVAGTNPNTGEGQDGVVVDTAIIGVDPAAPGTEDDGLSTPDSSPVLTPSGAIVVGGAVAAASPLFGRMFSAGLAAASAAIAGRFGSRLPSLPGFLTNRKNGKTDPKASAADKKDGDDKAPDLKDGKIDATLPDLGGGTGGGGGGGIGGGVGDLDGVDGGANSTQQATGNPSLNTGSNTAAATAVQSAAVGATKAATTPGFMPGMMPMGAAGMGGDMGGGRRIPPWLVETEDVWGESAIVAPTVIGEDFDPQGNAR